MNYDPKLREAMAEIDEVLKRHDIGGLVVLASTTATEFKMHVEPSWSLIRYIRKGEAVHLKIHQSKQPQLDQTCGMIYAFRDVCALFFSQLEEITKKIESHAKVAHVPFGSGINNDDREPT